MNYLDSLKQQHPEITKYSDDEIISVLPKIDPSLSGMEPQALRSFALAEQEPSGLWGLAKSGYHNVKGSRAVADAAGDLSDLNDPEFYEQDLQPRKVQTGSLLGMSGDELRRRSIASTGGEDQLIQEAQRRLDTGTKHFQKAAEYKLSPTTEQFLTGSLNPDSDILSDLMADPVTIIAEIGAQSAYGSLESALQGAALGVVGGPAGMMAGSGTGSARIEFANSVVEGLREAGVDVTDAQKLRAQLAEAPDLFAQVTDKAKKRAASVGALDGAAMGLASVPMGIGRNTAAKVGTNLAFQGGVQSGLGAGGEALGQYTADGEIGDARAIAAEAVGELVTAPVDVAAATYGGMNGRNASAADRAAASTDEAIQQAKQFEDQLNRTSFFSGKPNGQVTAADMGLQMPEQRDWSQYEVSPTERPMAEVEPQQQEQAAPRQSARDMSGLDGLIITADRTGFTDEAALLRTSQRLYRQADEARTRGDDAAASRFVERGNRLYQEATETNDQVREIADQFPVPYVAQSEVTSGELVPSNAPNFTMPEQDIQGEGVTVSTRSNQPLLEQQAARLESNNPETPFIMGRDPEQRPERTFTPVPDEVEGVGRNAVERTAQAKTNALPAGNAARAITPDQYRQVIEQVQLANRTPKARQTPEMLEALEVRQQVRNGDIQVTETPEQPVIPEAQQPLQQPAIEQQADMRAPKPPEVRLRANGQPFANERAARISPAFRDNRDYATVVPVDGGFAVQIDTQARDRAETQAVESAQAKSEQAKRRMFREPDTVNDDMLDAIALMGGIDRAEAEAEGIDPANFGRQAGGIRYVFPRQNGDSFDGMAERLAQYGYLDPRTDRLDDLRAKLDQAINGNAKIMTPEGYEALAEKEAAAEAQLQQEHEPLADDITSDEAWAGEAYANALEQGVPIPVIDAILEQYSDDPVIALVELNDAINQSREASGTQAGESQESGSDNLEATLTAERPFTPEQAAEIWGSVDPDPEPLLSSYTESDLQAQADTLTAVEEAEARAQREAEQKAQADAEVNDFSLTGSNRPADVAAAAGQNDMFGLGGTPRNKSATQQAESTTPVTTEARSETEVIESDQAEAMQPEADNAQEVSGSITANGVTVEVPTIDQQLVDDYNRATHMGRGRDLNAELRSEAEGLLNELAERKYTMDTPEQKAEAKRLIEAYLQAQAEFSQWDARYSASNPSWIVTGRSGRNMDRANRANERHMDEYTKRVDRLQAQRDRIGDTLYKMRPQEVQENQALSADLRNITQQAGHILGYLEEGKNALVAETRKWASPKAHKLIERSLEADRGRTIEHIRELENTKAVQDAGGLVKVFGPRSKAGKLVKELLQAPPALQRRGFEPLGIESVVTAETQPEKGMPVEKVQALVDAFQKAYNGNVPLNFKVAATQEELYGKGATIEEYGVIKGSYHPASGEIRLAARNLSEMGDAVETLRHEVLGHYGLNTFTPADKRRILDQLIEARDSEGSLADTWAEIDELYADKSDDIRAEEVFAKVVESEPAKVGKLKAFVDRLLYNLNAAMRRAGIIKAPLKLNDVRRMARYVAEGIRSGRRQQQTFPASDEALFRRGGPQSEPGAFAVPEETWTRTALRKMADKFQVLKDLQKNIQDAGGTVNESNDAYLAEELFHGKTEEDLRQMRETFIKPLADKMAKFGIEQKDLDQYLYAKHAPERNAHIAEINPELQEAGSGMSDAKAAEIIQQTRESGKLEQYEQLAGMVYDMLETRRETIRSAGLEEDGMIDAWESKYEFYVPLKGWAVDEKQDSMARTGSGFNIAGKESKRAMGRSTEAASPSSYAIQDLTETLIRRRKNEVGNALLKLVQDNPNKGYWQVFTDENPDMDRRIFKRKDPMTGETIEEVRETPIPMAMMSDKYFQTKRDGKAYFIKLEDERLMKAMKNIGPDTSNFFIRSLGAVNRVLSSLNTSYNPEFVVGNFARDVQTAVLNLMAEQSRDDGKAMGEKIAKQTVKDIPKAMKAVYRGLRNKDEAKGGEWQKWFTEFREAGAKTGWFDMKDIDGQAADLQALISMSKGGVKGTAMKWFKATGQMVEDLNGSVENAVRLSAYVNARKAGISQAKAASLAKNMTVNFNRRGEVGTTLNALYMFANASIQGSMNFARTMIGLKGQKGDPIWQRLNTAQKVAAGLVMGSYAIAMANRFGAGEDDDGENWYDKVPDYVKERNLVIMKSLLGGEQDGSYWTIPLPYGYNIFHVLGNALEGTTNGNTSIGKAATDLTLATLGSFSPIGFQESQSLTGTVVRNITPTIGKPLVDIGFNENFMGTSIYNENFPFGTPKPESQLGRRSTPEGYKAIAEFLNDVSGGSQWRSGYIDINPDVMRYVANYFTGAAGKFVFDKAPNNIYHLATLTPIEARETLFISRVSGRVLPYDDREKFYTRRDEINQTEAEWKGLTGGDRVRFYRDNRQLLALRPLIQSTEKQLKSLRQQRDRIYAMDLPRKEQEARLESIEARMKRIIDRFNRRYKQATSGD